jgi:LysR family transcriptional regulator, glycine cleavage system transcriptional activator
MSLANLALQAALDHQGVAMGRMVPAEDLLASGTLVAPSKPRVKYYVVYPSEHAERPRVRAISTWLREQAAEAQ